MQQHSEDKCKEVFIVADTDTCACPGAMMIKHIDANIAMTTMFSAISSEYMTYTTVIDFRTL
jgi:hypothetical protein